nr:response regulator [uncultured Roseateles sp.]
MLKLGSTILLLDDFPDSMEPVATWLAIEGWRPVCARNVEEALSCLAHEPVDAVVMEPHLRSGNALLVALAARRMPKPILLISMSAVGRVGDATSYEPTVFDFNLVKPVLMQEVARLLRADRRP